MSEYIVDVGNAVEEYIEHFDHMATTYADNPIRELIVRCRDCKYCMAYWRSDYCDYFKHVTNDPDGYCAWGERWE